MYVRLDREMTPRLEQITYLIYLQEVICCNPSAAGGRGRGSRMFAYVSQILVQPRNLVVM